MPVGGLILHSPIASGARIINPNVCLLIEIIYCTKYNLI